MDIKEAVDYLKIKNRVTKQQIESGELWLDNLVEGEKKDIEAIEVVLAELKKKDNEIEKYKSLYQKALNRSINLEAEKIRKDKLIAELVNTLITLREKSNEDCFIPRSYRDINDCIKTNCADCIIEYFKRFF